MLEGDRVAGFQSPEVCNLTSAGSIVILDLDLFYDGSTCVYVHSGMRLLLFYNCGRFHPSAALVACHSLVGCKSAWAAGCTSCRALGPSCRVLLCALCSKSFILPTPYTLRATRRVSSRYEPHRRRAYLKYSMGDEARRVVEEGDGCRRGPWRITVRSAIGNYVCSCIVRGCLDLPPWRSELPRAPPPADIPCRD